MGHSIISCPSCGLVQSLGSLPEGSVAECSRCDSVLTKSRRDSLGRTAALSLAALLLYIPANIYPILRMEYRGVFSESTVWDGCVRLFQDGQWPVAVVVFLASLLIPLLKLMGLFFVVITAKFKMQWGQRARTRIYRFIEVVGTWAMLDVFLVAVLVALVKLGRLATVTPGPGLVAFSALVVLTIMATASFEPREIWDTGESDE